MTRAEEIFYSTSSLAILLVIGFKLHELDMPAARFVRSFNINFINQMGDIIALAGQGLILTGVFVGIAAVGWWLGQDRIKEIGLRGLLALLLVTVVVQLLKHIIGRPRPRFAHADEIILGPSLLSGLDSFPSGHAINIFAGSAVLGWFLPNLAPSLFVLGGLVAISRVLRGSHFPTDVYAGSVLGLVIGTLVAAGFRHVKDQATPWLIRVGVPWIVLVFLAVWIAMHPAPEWPQRLVPLATGVGLVGLGMVLRIVSNFRRGSQWSQRAVGNTFLLLGAVLACGPWWMGGLVLAAFLPALLHGSGPDDMFFFGLLGYEKARTVSRWKREALTASAALLVILVLCFLQGQLPLAS
jgi:membrane-associated phospholipid phosphatase